MLSHGLHRSGQALLRTQGIQLAEDSRRHPDAPPFGRCGKEARKDQGQARELSREPGDKGVDRLET